MTEPPRTVQSYIDQTPAWPDGTPTVFVPMTGMQWRIWRLAIAGKFFEGLVVFMTGVALPLIVKEFGLTAAQRHRRRRAAGRHPGRRHRARAASPTASAAGRCSWSRWWSSPLFLRADRCSRPNFPWLVVCLFGIGLALGCDYPTAHLVISESIRHRRPRQAGARAPSPSRRSARWSARSWAILILTPTARARRLALDVCHGDRAGHRWWCWAALFVTDSPPLADVAAAQGARPSTRWRGCSSASRAIPRKSRWPTCRPRGRGDGTRRAAAASASSSRSTNRRATILASVPWFLQDLGDLRHRHLHADDPRRAIGHETRVRAECQRPRSRATSLARQGRGAARHPADRRHPGRGAAGRSGRPHPPADHRASSAAPSGLALAAAVRCMPASPRAAAAVRRLHAVQLHDQRRPQRADLPAGRRGLPDRHPRQGRGLRRRPSPRSARC